MNVAVALVVVIIVVVVAVVAMGRKTGCARNSDCAGGLACVAGECVPATPVCLGDSQCPPGAKCVDGLCVPGGGDGPGRPPPVCLEDRQCPPGFVCRGGTCIPEEGKDPGEPDDEPEEPACDEGADCGSDRRCAYAATADGRAKGCCPPGSTTITHDGVEFCADMPVGAPCRPSFGGARFCRSTLCEPNNEYKDFGACFVRPAGAKCQLDAQCGEGGCAWPGSGDAHPDEVCCPPGRPKKFVCTRSYCSNAPKGTRCYYDGQCASGNCKGNGGVGACTALVYGNCA